MPPDRWLQSESYAVIVNYDLPLANTDYIRRARLCPQESAPMHTNRIVVSLIDTQELDIVHQIEGYFYPRLSRCSSANSTSCGRSLRVGNLENAFQCQVVCLTFYSDFLRA
jgi:hypothetical protein